MNNPAALKKSAELLTQLATLGEEGLGRLMQRMHYVRELLTRINLPSIEEFKDFLNKVANIIDCDAQPVIPDGWKVVEHQKGGKLPFHPAKILLYLSEGQKYGRSIKSKKLREELKGKKVLNACVLDFLLANQHLIPEEWKGEHIYFWGTIYRNLDGHLCVRCLYWYGDRWCWHYFWLGGGWCSSRPAAVLASE